MGGSGNACEKGAPTPYGSASNGQQEPPPLPFPQKKPTFTLEEEWANKTAAMSFDGDWIHR